MAQSTATISGQFRLGLKHDAAGNNSLFPDQRSGNVINFAVSEDLGGGLSAFASSQLRYDSSNGQFRGQSGPANNEVGFHLATLGFKSNTLGTLQMGRIGFDQLWGYNPWGSSGANVNVSGNAGATENGQVRYTSPSMWGFNVVIGGSFENNNSGATHNGRQAMLNYANGPLAATVMYERFAASVPPGTQASNRFRGIGASYDFGFLKLMGIDAVEKTDAGARVADGYSISAAAPIAGFVFKAGWLNDQMGANKDKTSLGLEYALSKRTVIEANGYKVKGDQHNTYWLGARHSF